jgi:hypothetical protein
MTTPALDIEISYADDSAPSAPATSAPTPAKKPRTLKNPGVLAGRIDATGAARAKADEVAAKQIGLSPRPPVYEIGSRVNATGVGNFRRSRDKFEVNPYLSDLSRTFCDQIKNEAREDVRARHAARNRGES